MLTVVKRWIVAALESACVWVDHAPSWSFPFLANWIGCGGRIRGGLSMWALRLDDRWHTGAIEYVPLGLDDQGDSN